MHNITNRRHAIILFALFILATLTACPNSSSDGGVIPPPPDSVTRLNIISGSPTANPNNSKILYNVDGDGLAIWENETGVNTSISYSIYSTTLGTWTDPMALEISVTEDNNDRLYWDIATNGTGFMLTYHSNFGIYARLFDFASGWEADGTLLSSTPGSLVMPRIASNGDGYAIAYGLGRFYYHIYTTASGWTSGSVISSPWGMNISSNGSGYAAVWCAYDAGGERNMRVTVYDGTNWSAPVAMNAAPMTSCGTAPNIGSDGSGYAVVWPEADVDGTNMYGKLYSVADGWLAADRLSNTTGYTGFAKVASDGSGYAAVWQQGGDRMASINATATAGGWSSSQSVGSGSNHQVVGNGGNYNVVWAHWDGTSNNVMSNRYLAAGGWQGETMLEADTGQHAPLPAVAAKGAGYSVAWNQQLADRNTILLSEYDADWSTPIDMNPAPAIADSALPAVASNDNNIVVAVWRQYHNGKWQVVSRIAENNVWGDITVLVTLDWILAGKSNPSVVSNGTTFMVMWSDYGVHSQIYDPASGWGSVLTADSGAGSFFNPVASSDGTGYAAAWENGQTNGERSIRAAFHDAVTGWATPVTLSSTSTYTIQPRITSNGSGYSVAWLQRDVSVLRLYARVYTVADGWLAEVAIDNGALDASHHQLASNNSGYAATWAQDDGSTNSIYANLYTPGGGWSGATNIETGLLLAASPTIASDGSGYAVGWTQSDGALVNIYANIYSSGAWLGESLVETSDELANSPFITRYGTGYGLVWLQMESGFYSLYGNQYASGSWGTPALIESNGGDIERMRYRIYPHDIAVSPYDNGMLAVWAQTNEVSPHRKEIWALAF